MLRVREYSTYKKFNRILGVVEHMHTINTLQLNRLGFEASHLDVLLNIWLSFLERPLTSGLKYLL